MPTYKEQQVLEKVCKVTRQKQIKYYDFIPFLDFQYEKIIFNCQPSHFSPCSAVPVTKGQDANGFSKMWIKAYIEVSCFSRSFCKNLVRGPNNVCLITVPRLPCKAYS